MIAIVYPQFYGVGGIARYLDSFLANLPAGHPPVILITGDEHRCERVYEGVEIIHIPFLSSRFNLVFWSLAVRRKLRELFELNRIRVVNFHFPPLIPGLFLPANIPMLLTAHTTYLGMSGSFYPKRYFKSPWGRLSVAIKKWMEQRIFAQAAAVITLTEQGLQEVKQYGYPRSVSVIPNGVDVSKFVPEPNTEKTIDVLFAGRVEVRKGSRPMVEFCRIMIAKKPDVQICIVGYGDDDEYVRRELAPFAKNIRLAGKVPFSEMMSYYCRSRVYASTSYYEGLPGTCLEAMAMELPVVAWDFLFYRGLVLPDVTGTLVEPDAIDDMVSKTIDLLDDPGRAISMGRAGRVQLQQGYAWHELAARIVTKISSLAGAGPA
jgi:glycosyltransferase involved in cell wall biosynthesis